MTTITDNEPTEAPVGHGHDLPSDAKYVKITLILAFITALEVGTYFIEEATTTLLVGILVPMMIVKFLTVAGYFMHLKYDNPIFRRVFLFGLCLSVVVFCVMLTTFGFFSDEFLRFPG
ncbi:MAG: hypothetical protein EXQ71_10555 [Acidimicrobiia bacterium]|nr:hypothetical protein [Acidimicrobiia bacterium]